MDNTALQLALCEISISIGSSNDLKKMLDETTQVFLSRLNCSSISIYELESSDSELIYTKPKVITKNQAYLETLNCLEHEYKSDANSDVYQQKVDETFFYLFELKNFGFFVLSKEKEPLPKFVMQALKKINLKMVNAIKSCIDHRDLIINRKQLIESQAVAKIGSWDHNFETDHLWWSQETWNILDLKPNENTPSFELFISAVHPQDREKVKDAFFSSVENKTLYQVEHRLLLADGTIKHVQEYGKTVYDDQGKPIRSYGSMQDISERKLTQQTLQQQATDLDVIFESIPLILFVKDAKTREYLRMNEACEKFLGLAHKEAVGKSDYEILPQQQAELITQYDSKAIATEGIYNIPEERIRTPEGNQFVRTKRVKVNDIHGQPKYILGIGENITQQKKDEVALKLFSEVIENLSEGIMICDADANLVYVNPGFELITGYQFADIKGKNPSFLQSGKHGKEFYQEMWDKITNHGNWQGEVWNKKADGNLIAEWLSISSIFDEAGNVVNYIAVFNDLSKIKESEEELRYLAHHDSLTRLPNRVLLNDRLEHALAKIAHNDSKLAVIYLDLDHFKNINDSFGHPHGDKLLQEVARRLLAIVSDADTVSRVSGDEFVVLLEDIVSADEVSLVAQSIVDSFNSPIAIDDNEIMVTTSMGIAIAPNDCDNSVELLKVADTALYRAKDLGRNTFEFYSQDMTSSSFETLFMLNSLHKALEKDEFVLHYQPQIYTKISQFTGVEALLRWQHPELGMISPAKFIPVAEDSGLIVRIGEWVLRESCFRMKRWLEMEMNIDYIAVNISPRQLMDKNFISMVEKVLHETELPGEHIELEITETLVMKDANYSELLVQLKRLGLRISIDDFGTGYSSLTRLKSLPIDKLKIDMSFIKGIPANQNDATIVKSIIGLAKGMKLQIIAEGVETQAQAVFLMNNGCTYAQGYFYSKPLEAKKLEGLIEKQKRLMIT